MKKSLLCFSFFLCLLQLHAQVTFCPPGAKWHYSFQAAYPADYGIVMNRTASYIGDSVLNGQSVKVILSDRFFLKGDFFSSVLTLIKQTGDTIFMRNPWTNHQWQVLYNFSALPGQTWTNTFTVGSSVSNYTTIVNSVGTRIVNADTLKELHVSYVTNIGYSYSGLITERLGSSGHLFNYVSQYYVHSEQLLDFLCYADVQIGGVQLSEKPCDFSNDVGLNDELLQHEKFLLFPNPVQDVISVGDKLGLSRDAEITLLSISGKEIMHERFTGQNKLNVSAVAPGLYVLQIRQNGQLLFTTKIVKE